MNRGKLIVLEGPNGSGKSTQAKKLLEKFEAAHLIAKIFNYPDISNSLISRSINRMKNNPDYDLSHASRVLLDAVTSSETMKTIDKALTEGIYCICESSYITTIVKYCFLNQIDNYEDIVSVMSFANMNLKPDLTIVFDAPPKVLIERKSSENTLSIEDLEKIRTGYLLEAKTHNYPIIFSTDSVESISNLVWSNVTECLAVRISNNKNETDTKPTSVSEILNYKTESISTSPSIIVDENIATVNVSETNEIFSHDFIDSVLKITDNIYGFKDRLDIVPIAATLSRSKGEDVKDILIEEFNSQQQGGVELLKKVIDRYGKDTIKRLSYHFLVIEGISGILIDKIKSELNGLYLEQSSLRSKDYFIPKELDEKTRKDYKQTLNQIYSNQSVIEDKLTKHLNKTSDSNKLVKIENKTKAQQIAMKLLPVATNSSIALFASNQTIETLIRYLTGDNLQEANIVGKRILTNMKQLEPLFFANQSNFKRENRNTNVRSIAKEKLNTGFSTDFDAVALTDYYPKNELELVPYILFENSELSLKELKNEVIKWTYEEKINIIESYLNEHLTSSNALETVKYSFDIVCDYNVFREFLSHQDINDLVWQELTPRYGYELPKIIEDANLVDEYQECFDLSVKLYSQLKLKNYHDQAQYATLFGHKMRLQITINANNISSFLNLENNLSAEQNNFISQIKEHLFEVHPIISDFITRNSNDTQELKKSNNSLNIQKTRKSR